jgi:HlyD family secretion protein
VTKKDVEVGEIVTAGKNVISVISDSDLEIEANVSEINIGKVAVGNPVVITMDAFPGEKFSGTVSYIDPGETLLDGVVNYKVTIAINKSDKTSLIKSGLTTNLEIITNTKSGVLRVPVYSVKDGKVLKQVAPTSKEFVESPVTLGVVGGDGYAEAVSGVNEGDVIRVDNTTTQ